MEQTNDTKPSPSRCPKKGALLKRFFSFLLPLPDSPHLYRSCVTQLLHHAGFLCPPSSTFSLVSGMICEFRSTYLSFLDRLLKRMPGCRSRYPVLSSPRTSTPDYRTFSQYYALATGTILFYDYFLTLADEVRLQSSSRHCLNSLMRPLVADHEDQIRLVREENLEYVSVWDRSCFSLNPLQFPTCSSSWVLFPHFKILLIFISD